MAKTYPVDFKGTAFGDPAAVYHPQKVNPNADQNKFQIKNNNQNTLAQTKIQTVNANPVAANKYQVGYKGTAFGDPAKLATNQQPNGTANQITGALDPTKLNTTVNLNLNQMTNATVAYKGTAFGDPAAFPNQQDQDRNNMKNNVTAGNPILANQVPKNVLNLLA